MKKNLIVKNNRLKIFLLIFISLFLVSSITVYAVPTDRPTKSYQERCDEFKAMFRINKTDINSSVVEGLPRFCTLGELILYAIRIALIFAGSFAVLFIIIGGYWYLTSAGNEEQAEKGRKTLTNSIIGLTVIIMSFVIVRVITTTLTGDRGGSTSTPATSTSTSATTGSGQDGGGGSTNSGRITSEERAALGNTVQISTSSNGNVTVTAIIPLSSVELAKKACEVPNLEAGALKVFVEGYEKGSSRFTKNFSNYTASVTVRADTLRTIGRAESKTAVDVFAFFCATTVNSESITVPN